MSNRPLSMNPEAVRKRAYRERKRAEARAAAEAAASVPVTAAAPVTAAVAPSHPLAPPQAVPMLSLPAPAPVEPPAPPAPPPAPPPELMSTEVVQGPGAESFGRPTVLDMGAGDSEDGEHDQGNDNDGRDAVEREFAPRLVDPPPPPPPPQTTPEEAAMLASLVSAYCVFGWGLLASKHEEQLGALAETVSTMVARAKPELRAVLSSMSPREKFQAGLGMLGGVVEESTARVLVKYNVRIPWQDELLVGTGVGTATFGVVQAIRESRTKSAAQPTEAPREATANDNAPAPSWSSRPSTAAPQDAEDADIVVGDEDGPPRNLEAWT